MNDDLSDDDAMTTKYREMYAQDNAHNCVRLYTHANYDGTIRSESLRKLCVAYSNVFIL